MNHLDNLGRNNPLMRRVQRHAQMSALFGAPPQPVMRWHTAVSAPITQPLPTQMSEPPVDPAVEAVLAQPTEADTAVSPPSPSIHVFAKPAAAPQTAVSRTAQPAQPAQPAPTLPAPSSDEDPNWRRLQTIYDRHQQKTLANEVEQKAAPDEAPAKPTQTKPISSEPGAHAIQRQDDPVKSASPARPTQQSEQSPYIKEDPAQLNAQPLEDIWPVQRNPETSQATPPLQRTVEHKSSQSLPISKADSQAVQDELHQIAPEQKTDSPIDVILPTRPRPQPRVQRQQQPEQADEQPVVQDENMAVSPPPMIQTPIGPLPADMWETLGQKPPTKPAQPTESSPVAPSPSAAPIQRTPVSPQADSSDSQQSPPAPAPIAETPVPFTPLERDIQPDKKNRLTENIQRYEADRRVESETAVSPAPPSTNPIQAKPITQKPQQTLPMNTIQRQFGLVPDLPVAMPTALPTPPDGMPTMPGPSDLPQTAPEALTTAPALANMPSFTPPAAPGLPPAEAMNAVRQPEATAAALQENGAAAASPIVNELSDAPANMMEMMPPQAETAVSAITSPTLASAATTALDALTDPAETESADFDIDELSRRVYQTLKRKIAVEQERGNGRYGGR